MLSWVLLMSNSLLYAGTSGATEINKSTDVVAKHIYVQISASIDSIRINDTQSLMLLTPYQDIFTGKQKHKPSGSLGLGLGIEHEACANLLWQMGLTGYVNTAVQAQGTVWQFGLPDFENSSYSYQVQSSRIMAVSKLSGSYQQKYHPYISGEVGSAFNRAYAYNETPFIQEQLPIAPFSNKTYTSFSWGAGIGFDVDMRANLRMGIGYQFSDLGKVRLGLSPAQETGATLSIAHLYDNQVRIQLTTLI